VRFPTSAGLPPAAGRILPAGTLWSIGVRGAATGFAAAETPRSGHERAALQRRLSVNRNCCVRTECLSCARRCIPLVTGRKELAAIRHKRTDELCCYRHKA